MSEASGHLIGLDLGGSSIKAVAVSTEGVILESRTVGFEADSEMAWAGIARKVIKDFTRALPEPPLAIGLSAPGLAAHDERSIAVMPGRLKGLEGFNWTDYLRSANSVRVLNDAHAALLGEVWLGAARGRRNVAMLTLGTGVGGALMLEGKLYRGHIGRAGHLGHITLNAQEAPDITGMPGSLEDAVGNWTIEKRSGGLYRTTHDLIAAHERGERGATSVWLRSVHDLAAGLASIINVIDPELIVVGGGIARAEETLFVPLREYLARFEWRPSGEGVEVVPATLGEIAGALGAAFHAWEAVG